MVEIAILDLLVRDLGDGYGSDVTTTRPSLMLDMATLRAELGRQNLTRTELARRLGHPASTLSTWLREVAPAPADLVERIELALSLPRGTLMKVDR